MKIYVVYDNMDCLILGAYSTREKAQERIDKQWEYHLVAHPASDGWFGFSKDLLEIEEQEIDKDWRNE